MTMGFIGVAPWSRLRCLDDRHARRSGRSCSCLNPAYSCFLACVDWNPCVPIGLMQKQLDELRSLAARAQNRRTETGIPRVAMVQGAIPEHELAAVYDPMVT